MRSADSSWPSVFRVGGQFLFALVLAVFLGACDGGGSNDDGVSAPTVEREIQDQDVEAGGDPFTIDLGPVFSSPSGAALSYSTSSSDTSVATSSVANSTLTVAPGQGGEAEITVTARNEGGQASDNFTVSVFAEPPGRP